MLEFSRQCDNFVSSFYGYRFCRIRVSPLFSFLCFVFCFLFFFFVLCHVPNVTNVSLGCPFLIVHSVFSNVYLLFAVCPVSCTRCCQCLWIVHSRLLLRFSLTFIYYLQSVLCNVPNVASVSGFSILDCSFCFF